jgi:hypothetical protein
LTVYPLHLLTDCVRAFPLRSLENGNVNGFSRSDFTHSPDMVTVYPLRLLTDGEIENLAREYKSAFDDFNQGEPEPENQNGVFGDHELVGQRKTPTRPDCGAWLGYKICPRTELHGNNTLLDGEKHPNEVFVRLAHRHCFNWRCPICYRFGASYREAGKIEQRIEAGSKYLAGMGEDSKAEHIVLSVPSSDYGLSVKQLRDKAVKVLASRGIIGGVLIPHAFRYHDRKEFQVSGTANYPLGWFFSFHWHVIGFIKGGYSRCRKCPLFKRYGSKSYNRAGSPVCLGCSGFEGVTRKMYESDRYIAKVGTERVSIFKTASYQLSHASIVHNGKRACPSVWFGTCSYRKLKVVVEKHKQSCPLCLHDLVRARYFGEREFCTDETSPNFRRSFWSPMVEGGVNVWVAKDEDGKGNFGKW